MGQDAVLGGGKNLVSPCRSFRWARVNLGLKPTLRVVQVVTMRGNPADEVAYAIAEKQLCSSHYFETALDLSFCVRGHDDPKQPGFCLIMAMGSEEAGLTGVKGSIVRKVAMGRSRSNLQHGFRAVGFSATRDTISANGPHRSASGRIGSVLCPGNVR